MVRSTLTSARLRRRAVMLSVGETERLGTVVSVKDEGESVSSRAGT
jgi:hypothetical protein